jgi:hypothetical protein
VDTPDALPDDLVGVQALAERQPAHLAADEPGSAGPVPAQRAGRHAAIEASGDLEHAGRHRA